MAKIERILQEKLMTKKSIYTLFLTTLLSSGTLFSMESDAEKGPATPAAHKRLIDLRRVADESVGTPVTPAIREKIAAIPATPEIAAHVAGEADKVHAAALEFGSPFGAEIEKRRFVAEEMKKRQEVRDAERFALEKMLAETNASKMRKAIETEQAKEMDRLILMIESFKKRAQITQESAAQKQIRIDELVAQHRELEGRMAAISKELEDAQIKKAEAVARKAEIATSTTAFMDTLQTELTAARSEAGRLQAEVMRLRVEKDTDTAVRDGLKSSIEEIARRLAGADVSEDSAFPLSTGVSGKPATTGGSAAGGLKKPAALPTAKFG